MSALVQLLLLVATVGTVAVVAVASQKKKKAPVIMSTPGGAIEVDFVDIPASADMVRWLFDADKNWWSQGATSGFTNPFKGWDVRLSKEESVDYDFVYRVWVFKDDEKQWMSPRTWPGSNAMRAWALGEGWIARAIYIDGFNPNFNDRTRGKTMSLKTQQKGPDF